MPSHSVQSKAFTIVELLIVIVVIAILAAISIVAYNSIRARAETSALKSEMIQLQKKIQTDVIMNDSESLAINAPLAYGQGAGVWKLADTLQNTRNFTMYSVFNTSNDMSGAWNSISVLTPATSTNYISLRITAAASSSTQGFWQTTAQTNQAVGSTANIRNTTGRHVGWISGDNTSLYAGFDTATGSSITPTAHSGWTFDNVASYSPAGIGAVSVLVFAEHHDAATRNLLLRWLDREYAIDYYN